MCVEKSAVGVTEMAQMVGLSRARFYQLLGTAFPFPIYDVNTRRPFFPPELQEACLEVRRRNCGVDGKPVLFHRRELELAPAKRLRREAVPRNGRCRELVAGLRSLGLSGATASQVEAAVKELRVSTTADKDGEVLRAVFLHLKRQDVSTRHNEG